MGRAVSVRNGLLASVALIVQLTQPLFVVLDHAFSWRDLILMLGGLFLIWKATTEIHDHVAGEAEHEGGAGATPARGARMTVAPPLGPGLGLDLGLSLHSNLPPLGRTNQDPILVG